MSKSHSLNAAHDQKTSLAQKKLDHTAILLAFAFKVKTSSERIVLPVKKNIAGRIPEATRSLKTSLTKP